MFKGSSGRRVVRCAPLSVQINSFEVVYVTYGVSGGCMSSSGTVYIPDQRRIEIPRLLLPLWDRVGGTADIVAASLGSTVWEVLDD